MASFSSGHRKKPVSPAASEARDWAAGLPRDILVDVFLKLGPCREIMCGAERACTAWRRVAVDEPFLWRRIDMDKESSPTPSLCAMARAAVDRSVGQCEAFSGPIDKDSLLYLVERAPILKSLHISTNHKVDNETLNMALKKLALIEDLEISTSYSLGNLIESVCQACPLLEKLKVKLPDGCYISSNNEYHNGGLCEISAMCKLRVLELFEFELTAGGLMAILDNCPLLESLHVTGSFCEIEQRDAEVLKVKLTKVKNLILPDDVCEHDDDIILGEPGAILGQ
ncbi:hypothetical protein EJB05_09638 [Eragrostis curvula]|uniref:F-box domain-containing protein n=1 Tax=Eragrostis curvula TaxID=38414 RepID=A0A5J9W373_9POAL|nr:hypothetical protein EJB05_09638 [Eragrostis curvula]